MPSAGSGGGLPAGTPIPAGASVRFASTHFSDGASVVIVMTAEFERQSRQYGSTGSNGIYDLPVRTVVATRTVQAYNKLQTLGTNVDDTGIGNPQFVSSSNKTTGAATTLLNPSHTSHPGASALAESKVAILAKSDFCTAVSAMVHGNKFGIFPSVANPSAPNPATFVYSQEIKTAVEARSTPPFNMVAFWACATIDPANPFNSPCLAAYKSVGFLDRAYAGFDKIVNLDVFSGLAWANYDPNDPNDDIGSAQYELGDHANLFWFLIHQGDTVQQALSLANAAYPPTHYNASDRPEKLPMGWYGDPRANLINVYLTQAEYDARIAAGQPTNVWWIKL